MKKTISIVLALALGLAMGGLTQGATITVQPSIGRHDFPVVQYDFPAIQAGIDAVDDGA